MTPLPRHATGPDRAPGQSRPAQLGRRAAAKAYRLLRVILNTAVHNLLADPACGYVLAD